MFSATGNLLKPDIFPVTIGKDSFHDVSALNAYGYIPGVSIISGTARALLGLVHTIVHLATAIFDRKNCNEHLQESLFGVKNIVRGAVETVPFAGNVICYLYDKFRIKSADQKFAVRLQSVN